MKRQKTTIRRKRNLLWILTGLMFIGLSGTLYLNLLGCSNDDDDFVDDSNDDDDFVSGVDLYDCSIMEKPNDFADNLLADANTRFGFNLLGEIYNQDAGKNIMISPTSVSIALAMLYNGALAETEQAMAGTLELANFNLETANQANADLRQSLENPDAKVELAIANAIWARQGAEFNADFLDRASRFFDAEIDSLDFTDTGRATKIINQWVDTNTEGKIPTIIREVNPTTEMMLINAIYFKGGWKREFDKSETRDGVFHLLDGGMKQVPMMSHSCNYPYLFNRDGEIRNFEAVSLPYGEGRVSMYIFLPDPDSSLDEFLLNLNAVDWKRWMSQFFTADVTVVLPRFKLEYTIRLNDALEALGMGIAFDKAGADFGGIASRPLSITRVIHKTFIEVNEEGTEAAAVTAIEVDDDDDGPRIFVVDRPFFFVIRDNWTETELFMGVVVEPM